ncbi:hypothetical protein SprV_0301073900 [Sparganum proliferum]
MNLSRQSTTQTREGEWARNRRERRIALVARELARYKVDIVVLSETRFSKQGQLEKVGAGYSFFWSGRYKADRRYAGASSSSSSSSYSSLALASTTAAPVSTKTAHNPDTLTNTNTTTTTVNASDVDSIHTCPHCDCTFNSHSDLAGHLRIYRTETGEPVPGVPVYTLCIRLHCSHTFTNRIGLIGHMRIHENLR